MFSGPLDLSAIARGEPGTYGVAGVDGGIGMPGGVGAPTAGPPDEGQQEMAAVMAPPDPRQAYDQAYGYILSGNYDLAETSFRQFIADHPDNPQAGSAHFWLGESYFARKRWREAANEFLDTYKTYPQSPKAPESLLKLGLSLHGLGETDAACATYSELGKKFPDAPANVRARVVAEQAKAQC
ncbi:tol-pal system protein YbgF [Methylobrevis pamukkalensis]|uniref:Tol-pal system protein YbgF n=1 Tax=Methylobrevis pamukkalensis TaxID=1439726 RepID=A0A1E3GPV1_9HYPH|nr:tol-pal system protein YbgF [Methylobrevis pamukkalensis]